MEIYDARAKDHGADWVSGSLVLALVEYLESILNNNAFVAIKLVPEAFLHLVGPSPIQHIDILILLSYKFGIGYFKYLI